MKINNKGYASTIIMFSILTLFLISMLMLVKTMNNSSSLNKKITEKVVDNIDYDASGTVQDQILELKTTITSMQNQIDNIKGEVINEIYPVGSIYMTTTYSTTEEVTNAIGGEWEKYAQGRTIIGEGTDESGYIYQSGQKGGNKSVTLSSSNIPSLSVTGTTNSTGNGYSIGYGSSNRTTSSNGDHNHRINIGFNQNGYNYNIPKSIYLVWNTGVKYTNSVISNQNSTSWYTLNSGAHTHTVADYYANSISGVAAHTHTFTGNYTNNNVSAISTESPYVVTYMYRRIK